MDTTKGTARRIGIVIDVACKRCDNFMTCTAYGATSVRSPLRERGWRLRYGNWHCPVCCRTRHTSPLKVIQETTDGLPEQAAARRGGRASDLSKMTDAELIALWQDRTPGKQWTITDELARRLAEVTAERDRLAGIVEKYEKTEDGVQIVPGMPLFFVSGNSIYRGVAVVSLSAIADFSSASRIKRNYYSTHEAAEAARCGGEVGNG